MNIREALLVTKSECSPCSHSQVMVNWLTKLQDLFSDDVQSIKNDLQTNLPEDYRTFCEMIVELVDVPESKPSPEQLQALQELTEEAEELGLYEKCDYLEKIEDNYDDDDENS